MKEQQIIKARVSGAPAGSPKAINDVGDSLGRLATQLHLAALSRNPQSHALKLRVAAVELATIARDLLGWPPAEPAVVVIRSDEEATQ